MKKTVFIKNAFILTASSLLLRFIGIIFKVWLAAEIGSEGIGLYQLVFSVYVLASTFATGGISTAVTRLVAEELALGSKSGSLKILRRSIQITVVVALFSLTLLFFGADFIAKTLIGDIRAVPALKILPFSLPFMGISSCIRGFFIAERKVTPNVSSQLFEQVVRISVIFILIKKFLGQGLAACCFAIIAGDTVAEILSCLLIVLLHSKSLKRLNTLSGRANPPYKILAKIMHIALPITSGRYLNSGLRTAENILVPKNLSKYKYGGENALSQFGMIKGMALPLLFFPSAILNSVSILLIPEISEAVAKKQFFVVKTTTTRILKLTVTVGIIFGAIFFVGGEQIGNLIYKNRDVGFLLKVLSPIVPLMYLDSISDGILKGLDQQGFTFKTAVSDSLIRIILILILLPKSGLFGFIGIMYFSNFLTCFLNVSRLLKTSGASFNVFNDLFLPTVLSLTLCLLTNAVVRNFLKPNDLVYIILLVGICLPLYILILFLLKAITFENLGINFKKYKKATLTKKKPQ